ncbi:MAG: DUF4157 domain-containing protein [Colwellia sp.]|nr:DUF4157 domain-containing protein [Colwellia sp.]
MSNNVVRKQKTITKSQQPSTANVFRSAAVRISSPNKAQTAKTSSPNDSEEKEADSTAQKVMRMSAPDANVSLSHSSTADIQKQELQSEASKKWSDTATIKRKSLPPSIACFKSYALLRKDSLRKDNVGKDDTEKESLKRSPDKEKSKKEEYVVSRQSSESSDGSSEIKNNTMSNINSSMSGGQPLPSGVRRFMEPRFKADFNKVRIHTDTNAAKLNRQVNAKAFAIKNHVFFGKDQFKPDSDDGKELIAHELTHTIQQGGAVQRKSNVEVHNRSEPSVQRLGISSARNYFAKKAKHIMGFTLLTLILKRNPINGKTVLRTPANMLKAAIELMPGGGLITQALENHGLLAKIANWLVKQVSGLVKIYESIKQSIKGFLSSLGLRDLGRPSSVWRRAKKLVTDPIDRIKAFIRALVTGIIRIVKAAILTPVSKVLSKIKGWSLLTAVLGKNPITGEGVIGTADILMGGFMKFIGQQAVWDNLKKAKAVPRAWAWFKGTLSGVVRFVTNIPANFFKVLMSLQFKDILNIPAVIKRVVGIFSRFGLHFIMWAGRQVKELLLIVISVVAPGVMPFLKKAGKSFLSIVKNPIRFLMNLLKAGKRGFWLFAKNFLKHLSTSLIQWLTGAMSGANIYIPKELNLKEIVKFILSVLGITWNNIKTKLVKRIGPAAVAAMEKGFELVHTLIKEGPGALWKKIVESVGNLKESIMAQIQRYIKTKVVQVAIGKIASMFTPAGAFIQAILAIYNTIRFLINRLKAIIRVVRSFVNSIASIAIGKIKPAAKRIENTMAGMLTLVISFLARFAGLGDVAERVKEIIESIRKPIEATMEKLADWVVNKARKLGRFVAQKGVPKEASTRLKLGMKHAQKIAGKLPTNSLSENVILMALKAIKIRYGFQSLKAFKKEEVWWIEGKINPSLAVQVTKMPEVVNIASPSGAVLISNYSRKSRTGVFNRQLFSGQSTLSQMHYTTDSKIDKKDDLGQNSVNLNYTIAAANDVYGIPSNFKAVDRKDPDENDTYSKSREAFPQRMRSWWTDQPTQDVTRIKFLQDSKLIDTKDELTRGAYKWTFIYSLLSKADKSKLQGTKNKENMLRLVNSLDKSDKKDLERKWKQRWGKGTHIHHIKPINFDGTNDTSNFIPLKAEKHVGSDGVHPQFWGPLKKFLMNIRD